MLEKCLNLRSIIRGKHQALMQEKNAILLALVGMPLTIFNVLISILRWDAFPAAIITFLSIWILWDLKTKWDERLQKKVNELNFLLKTP